MKELIDRPVRIRSYDPGWAKSYDAERALLERAVGGRARGGIHHIGSTAIAGVDAVPVIDILVGTDDATASRGCFGPLAELGYSLEPHGDAEMHCFCKPDPTRRAFDLYLAPADGIRFAEMLTFRELLRADLQMAIGYAAMKRDLADRLGSDHGRYAAAKLDLIKTVLARPS